MITIDKIIKKKQKNKRLSKKEIYFFVENFTSGEISEKDMTTLLRAICKNGMSVSETFNLTSAMLASGEQLDLTPLGVCLDKHSTGGVSDSTTLILAPLLASLNEKVVKMSGRSLGHTGGTIDKFEAFNSQTDIPLKQAFDIAENVGTVILSQSKNLVPADKKIYALRDKTDTVESLPLIASSIVSNKLASGAKVIVLDVKFGEGAFMKNLTDAKALAKLMLKILKKHEIKASAIITDMNQPLGYALGNEMEMREVIESLEKHPKTRLVSLSCLLAGKLLCLKNKISLSKAILQVQHALENKQGFEKLKAMILAQNGNLDLFKPIKSNCLEIKAEKSGYVKNIKTSELARLTHALCLNKDCKGILTTKKVGDSVVEGETLIKIYAPKKQANEFAEKYKQIYEISSTYVSQLPLVYDILD